MRIWLNVPYSQKDKAKRRGARWCKEEKLWFIPDDDNVAIVPLERWLKWNKKSRSTRTADAKATGR